MLRYSARRGDSSICLVMCTDMTELQQQKQCTLVRLVGLVVFDRPAVFDFSRISPAAENCCSSFSQTSRSKIAGYWLPLPWWQHRKPIMLLRPGVALLLLTNQSFHILTRHKDDFFSHFPYYVLVVGQQQMKRAIFTEDSTQPLLAGTCANYATNH